MSARSRQQALPKPEPGPCPGCLQGAFQPFLDARERPWHKDCARRALAELPALFEKETSDADDRPQAGR